MVPVPAHLGFQNGNMEPNLQTTDSKMGRFAPLSKVMERQLGMGCQTVQSYGMTTHPIQNYGMTTWDGLPPYPMIMMIADLEAPCKKTLL
eukprot:1552901-Amphidinium_carterae.1